jgi:hypothetical protein
LASGAPGYAKGQYEPKNFQQKISNLFFVLQKKILNLWWVIQKRSSFGPPIF